MKKREMMKKATAMVCAGILAAGLAACGSSSGSDKSASSAGSSGSSASAAASSSASSAASASSSGGSSSAQDGELDQLGYLSAAWSDKYCKQLSDAIVELGPEYGFEVNALNGAPSGTADVSIYIETIDALMAKNPDALMIQPLFSVPDYCMNFNGQLPITFVNIEPEISDNCKDLDFWYAGANDVHFGEQLAEEMSKGLKEGAKIGYICLTYGQTNAENRRKGFVDWMTENRPDVEIAEIQYVEKIDTASAQAIFEDWIQKYGVNGLDGVATQGNALTQGVVECMKSYGLDTSNFILAGVGPGNVDWVKEGYQYVDLNVDAKLEARCALAVARAQLDGTTDELTTVEGTDNVVDFEAIPVTIENVDEYDYH